MLAVLPQAPSRLRPDRWPERAEVARNKVLERMAVQGVWSREQVKESGAESIRLAPRQMPQLAPLFSRMMLGKSKSDKIVTTLDAGLQRRLEELAQNWKGRLPPRSSLAMIVVDHTDMRVRGWVGWLISTMIHALVMLIWSMRSDRQGRCSNRLFTVWRWMKA